MSNTIENQQPQDVGVNTLFSLGEGFLLKEFAFEKACFAEVVGSQIYKTCAQDNVPEVFQLNGKQCLIEEIMEAKSAYELVNEDISKLSLFENFIAETVYKVFTKAPFLTVPEALTWKQSIQFITSKFSDNRTVIENYIGITKYSTLIKQLKEIAAEADNAKNVTVLHRDFHLSNIRISGEGIPFLIDFEHAMQGPIELEFQNSLFWQDNKSIRVQKVVQILKSKGVPYSTRTEKLMGVVYLADQLNKAVDSNADGKLSLLVSMARKTILST